MSNALLQSGPPWLRLMVPGAYLALGLLALVNVVVNVINLPELGDGKVIALILTMRQIPAAKYAIGISVLRDLYFNVWLSPTAQALLPSSLLDSVGFIRTAGILLMAFASVTLLYWQRSRMRLLLACTTPVWLLFSAGYIEYYPFVAGALLAMLCWVFARPLQGSIGGRSGIYHECHAVTARWLRATERNCPAGICVWRGFEARCIRHGVYCHLVLVAARDLLA